MSTTHELLSKQIEQNGAADYTVTRLARYLLQRGMPNTAYATADQTVVGGTLTNSTYLNIANSVGFSGGQAVIGGRKYKLEGRLFVTSTASNGLKIDMNQGTATFSKLNGTYLGFAAASVAAASVTALTGTLSSINTILECQIDMALEASSSGSIGLRFAESANSTGVIVLQGSWLSLTEIVQ